MTFIPPTDAEIDVMVGRLKHRCEDRWSRSELRFRVRHEADIREALRIERYNLDLAEQRINGTRDIPEWRLAADRTEAMLEQILERLGRIERRQNR